jgi:hypothetical protein
MMDSFPGGIMREIGNTLGASADTGEARHRQVARRERDRANRITDFGVVEVAALVDLLLVDGDPLQDINLIADPAKNLLVIMKDGKIYKNTLTR